MKARHDRDPRNQPGLVLSRQSEESIMIGEDTSVVVVTVRGNKVRRGIKALEHIRVHRQNAHESIRREKEKGYRPLCPPPLIPRDMPPNERPPPNE